MTYCNENLIKNSIELTKMLVAAGSYQPEGNEAEIVNKISALFPKNTFRQIIDHGNNRASLIIKIKGKQSKQGLAFVGHTDTVALGDLSLWDHHPLEAFEKDGLIYGRGVADMKSGIAAMITAALCILDSKKMPEHDLIFCFTADEEATGMGVKAIVETGVLDDVAEIIIAEPSEQKIGLCEKGSIWLRIESHGVSAHGSRPEIGLNAIDALMEFKRRLAETIDTSLKNRLLGYTTISVTRFNGGIMTNVIPEEAVMEIDVRTLPSLDNNDVIAAANQIAVEMCAAEKRLKLQITVLNNRIAVETPENASMVQKMRDVFRMYNLDCSPKGLYFYTDMSQIAMWVKAPFIILGPGDDKQAHRINENVPKTAIETISRVYVTYIEKYYMREAK